MTTNQILISIKLIKKTTQPERKIESVVSGKVKTKKKSEMSKFKNAFISEDVSNVKDYIFMDVLIPAIKKWCLTWYETELI